MLYKISEFANLCGLTRETLLHYDEVGLLKPAYVSETGYRYYAMDQSRVADMISMLKACGLSLQEIRENLYHSGVGTRLGQMSDSLDKLRQQEAYIRGRRQALEQTVECCREGMECQCGVLQLRQFPQRYLIASRTNYTHEPEGEEFLRTFREHLMYCESQGLPTRFQSGEIIAREDAVRHRFIEYCYFNPVEEKVDDPRLLIQPAGLYAVYYCRGSYTSLDRGLSRFMEELDRHGYDLCGDIYEDDILDHFLFADAEQYIARIIGRVEVRKN